jgi:hypothetical protein
MLRIHHTEKLGGPYRFPVIANTEPSANINRVKGQDKHSEFCYENVWKTFTNWKTGYVRKILRLF